MVDYIESIRVPSHWIALETINRPGGFMFTKGGAYYARHFVTQWSAGAECGIGANLLESCVVQMSADGTSCACELDRPGFAVFASRSERRYLVSFSIRAVELPADPKRCENARLFNLVTMPECNADPSQGDAIATLKIGDRFDNQEGMIFGGR